MQNVATITPGDTLAMTCSLDIDGVPQELDGLAIRAQIRTRSIRLLADLVVVKQQDDTGALTLFELRADPAITAAWPLGQALIDITYTWPDGFVETTPIFGVQINRRITLEPTP